MTWMLIRASGMIAYGLLSLSAIWGLLLAGDLIGRRRAKSLTYVHESLSVAALFATGSHMALIYADDFVEFEVMELFVPGRSDWRPIAVSFGILSFYFLFLVALSFYVRKWIGQRVWRAVHYTSFGIWVAALVHGILAGTDRTTPWALWLYGATAAAVVVLVTLRYRGLILAKDGAGPSRSRERRSEDVTSR